MCGLQPNQRSRTDNVRRIFSVVLSFSFSAAAEAQIQVDLKFKRLQYIAYEPVMATLGSPIWLGAISTSRCRGAIVVWI